MKTNQKEPKLTYALNPSGKMVHIDCVERGLSCNCRCPKCYEPLVAKKGHEGGRKAQFAHQIDNNCHGSYMTALHKYAEQIIEEEKNVMAPAYKEICKQKLTFEHVEVEQRVERKDLQPDLVGITADGLRWFIEIRNTHEVDETKKEKLKESNITCLEIDVHEQSLDNLKSFLLESVESREWINNPNYELQLIETKRNIVSQIEKLFLDCPEITIPSYANSDAKIVRIKESEVLSKSEDGLYVRIKAISSDGIPFVFTIGCQEIIDTIKDSFEHEDDCSELIIFTDNFPLDSVISLNDLDIQWSYNSAHEVRIKKLKDNPNYITKNIDFCYSQCTYLPYYGKCIYLVEIISNNGVDYVVCNESKRQKDQVHSSQRSKDNNITEETNFTDVVQKKPKHEEPIQHLNRQKLPDILPFGRFWTIEEYYEQLQSSNSYVTENGITADIIISDKVINGILLLYKVSPEIKTYTPYHIVVISINDGNPKPKIVGVFINKRKALEAYSKRLSQRRNTCYSHQTDNNNDCPF